MRHRTASEQEEEDIAEAVRRSLADLGLADPSESEPAGASPAGEPEEEQPAKGEGQQGGSQKGASESRAAEVAARGSAARSSGAACSADRPTSSRPAAAEPARTSGAATAPELSTAAAAAAAAAGAPPRRVRVYRRWSDIPPALLHGLEAHRSYAVWATPGSSCGLVGVHTGAGCWDFIQPCLCGGVYVRGRDRLCGRDTLALAITTYQAEARRHGVPRDPTYFFW